MTALFSDEKALDVDTELVCVLEQQLKPGLSSEPALSFGVESQNGHVYRVIRTDSLWEAGRIFDMVVEMGFDIAPGADASPPGLSRVFRYRGETR